MGQAGQQEEHTLRDCARDGRDDCCAWIYIFVERVNIDNVERCTILRDILARVREHPRTANGSKREGTGTVSCSRWIEGASKKQVSKSREPLQHIPGQFHCRCFLRSSRIDSNYAIRCRQDEETGFRTRAMAGAEKALAPEERSMPRFLWHIFREEGLAGLWRGWIPRTLKIAPSCAIMISCYEVGKRAFRSVNERAEKKKTAV